MTSPRIHGIDLNPIELLRQLIRFDTSNPPGRERACLEFLHHLFSDAGLEPQLLGRDAERPNLIVRLRGRGEAPPLLLHGHVDVVPADPAEWTHPPFVGELVADEVWGRGAIDMKSGVAMMVCALLRTHAETRTPAADLLLALTSDEEAGSDLGAKYLVEEHAALFAGVRYALGEGGGSTQWYGGRPFYPISVTEKQRCLIEATITGAGGHAAFVARHTAMSKLGRLLVTLNRKRLPVHVTPFVREMLWTIAPHLPLHERLGIRLGLVPTLTDRLLDLFGKDGDALAPLLHNTAVPTLVGGGEATNVVPTELRLQLDGRLLPGFAPSDLISELETLAPRLARYELVREEPAPPATPDISLLPMLSDVLRERDPAGTPFPVLLPGYTDARHFARLGIQTYGFLPLKLSQGRSQDLSHAPDERIPVGAVQFGVECLSDAIRRYSG